MWVHRAAGFGREEGGMGRVDAVDVGGWSVPSSSAGWMCFPRPFWGHQPTLVYMGFLPHQRTGSYCTWERLVPQLPSRPRISGQQCKPIRPPLHCRGCTIASQERRQHDRGRAIRGRRCAICRPPWGATSAKHVARWPSKATCSWTGRRSAPRAGRQQAAWSAGRRSRACC